MLFQIFILKFKIKSSHEDFRLRIFKDDFLVSLLFSCNIRIWLGDIQNRIIKLVGKFVIVISVFHLTSWTILASLVPTTTLIDVMRWCLTRLWFNIIICRFDVNSFVIDNVSFVLIYRNNFILAVLSFLFVFKLDFNKTKATASIGLFITHDDSIIDSTKFLKVFNKISLLGLESETSYENFDLIIRAFRVESSGMLGAAWNQHTWLSLREASTSTAEVHLWLGYSIILHLGLVWHVHRNVWDVPHEVLEAWKSNA